MKSGSLIKNLTKKIASRFPETDLALDEPGTEEGIWYLDVVNEGHHVIVQWQAGKGFGVSCAPQHVFGDGADEIYQDLEAVYARIVSLLLAKTYTTPPPARLSELRKELGVSQETLAEHLNVRQAAISKLERRNDLLLSTVRTVIRALGGELVLTAKFPDGTERTLQFDTATSFETVNTGTSTERQE